MMNGTGPTTQQNKTVNFELTVDEVNVVLAGLGELPAKISLSVIDKVRGQAVAQLQPAEAVATPAQSEVVN